MQNFIVPTPADDVMSNMEQVAQITVLGADKLISTHWRGPEKTILVESVLLSQNTVTWYEIPETMTVGHTLSHILEADVHSNHDLYIRFGDGCENEIEPSHPMLHDATYFHSTWLDYAEKAIVFQSSIHVDVPQDNPNMVG
jgi:hypothetical protein